MKKSVLFFVLIISGNIFSQKYVPFPTSGAVWNLKFREYFQQIESYQTHKISYILRGDTVIDNIVYKKLCTYNNDLLQPIYYGYGVIREENKRIYFKYLQSTLSAVRQKIMRAPDCVFSTVESEDEIVLYDFNLKPGEIFNENNYNHDEVLSIDSILIGDTYRKRFKLYRDTWVEGIGSIVTSFWGTPAEVISCGGGGDSYEFICFSENDQLVYKNNNYIECNSFRKWSDFTYVPFPTESAVWRELSMDELGPCNSGCLSQHVMSGDTTINSTQYHKIYSQEVTSTHVQNTNYVGAMREQYKRILYIPKDNNNEIRLYDFSKNIGDTIQEYPAQNVAECNTVSRIDTINLEGTYRRVFYFNNEFDNNVWIEGVGSIHGLLLPFYKQPTCLCVRNLVCFYKDNQQVYLNPTYNSCNPLIDGVDSQKENFSLSLIPNPVKNTSVLKWSDMECVEFQHLIITDVLGRCTKTINVSEKTEVSITKADFLAGIYFLKLVSIYGETHSLRMVVQ